MTRDQLEKYHDIVVSIAVKKTTVVTDSVKGSSPDYPYTSHSVTIHGIQKDDKTRREIKRLEQKKAALDAYIDGIEDERAKMLIDMLYRKNMCWNDIEAKTGGSYDADKQYLIRFFKLSPIVT